MTDTPYEERDDERQARDEAEEHLREQREGGRAPDEPEEQDGPPDSHSGF